MPPKKPAKRNPFYYFMMEVKRNTGNQIDNNAAQEIAGARWAKMTPNEKKKYEIRAAEERNNVTIKKYTSEGIDIEEIEKKMQGEREWLEEMKNHISEEIRTAHKYGSIDKKNFFILYFNKFCYQESNNRYFPAEVGLLWFNLREGVLEENVYHSMIQPGPLPMGFFNTAMVISNESHKITPPSNLDYENNSKQVFDEICEFVSQRLEAGQDCPILYVKEKYMKMCQNILDSWTEQFNEKCFFKVYNLQMMLNELRSTIEQTNIVMANSFAFYEISKDVYSYVPNIACEFHEMADVQLYCAKSIVTRQAYVICDNCCPILDIPLIPGHHVPEAARTDWIQKGSSRATSSYSKRSDCTFESKRSDADTRSVISYTSKSEGWDTESMASNASTVTSAATLEEQFPALGGGGTGRSNEDAGDYLSQTSNGSMRSSYSGAAGYRKAAMPNILRDMSNMSLEGTSARSTSTNPLRYNRQWSQLSDSETSEASNVSQNPNKSFNNIPDDFPALGGGGRGRGKARGRGGYRK